MKKEQQIAYGENKPTVSKPFKEKLKDFGAVVRKPFAKIRNYMNNHPLLSYSLRRVGSALLTIFVVITVTFLLLRMLPAATYYMSYIDKFPIASRDRIIAAILAKLGLDKPMHIQLLNFYYQILPFFPKTVCEEEIWSVSQNVFICSKEVILLVDFGTSYTIYPGAAVMPIIAEAMPYSFVVGVGASVIEIVGGYPLGVLMAKYHDRIFDRIGNLFIVLMDAIPPIVYYYVIYLVLLVNYTKWNIPFQFEMGNDWSLVPPMFIVGIAGAAEISLWIRRYMVDELNSDYVRFARSKGLSENVILFKHVFRNALVPFVRTIPAAFLFSLMGSYFVERVFLIPGIGDMLVTAIQRQDNAFVQALVVIFALISTVAFLAGDLATVMLDPRVALIAKKGD
jgi:oligopeptide transport system permease protein